MKYFLSLFAILFSLVSQATFLPPSDIRIDQGPRPVANISEQQFHQVIDEITKVFSPIVSKQGGNLSIQGSWTDDKLNAGSNQMLGSWQIKVTGGLARRPELTKDGFSLIICHEMGHHLGGFAFAPSPLPFISVWAANEGEADYYATQSCTRTLWGSQAQANAQARLQADTEVRSQCDQVWKSEEDQNLCYRTLLAVRSMTQTMAGILGKPAPSFSTPDPSVVDKTQDGHPAVQCRTDTALQGALCDVAFDNSLIPGKSVGGGPFSLDAEKESASHTCTQFSGRHLGLRPTCWFKARM